jgi:hypothetical protein
LEQLQQDLAQNALFMLLVLHVLMRMLVDGTLKQTLVFLRRLLELILIALVTNILNVLIVEEEIAHSVLLLVNALLIQSLLVKPVLISSLLAIVLLFYLVKSVLNKKIFVLGV